MTPTSPRIRWSPAIAALLLAACGAGEQAPPARELAPAPSVASQASTGGACMSTPAHPKHAAASCTTCHLCAGNVEFDPAGAAYAAGQPAPSYDHIARRCSSVACHGVPAGTYDYWFPDGTGEPALNTVAYGGALRATPDWLTTSGIGCAGCHDNPPRNGVWHSGYHGGQGPTGTYNQCQFCHPDATGTNGVGTALSTATSCGPSGNLPCAALHRNGALDVKARFSSRCFQCH